MNQELSATLHNSAGTPNAIALRDSVCERPAANADGALDTPDFGLFRAGKKLCVRHEKMADEGVNIQLQKSLDALPLGDRQAINAVWSTFSSSSHPRREIILKGLLTMCCFSQLSMLSDQVHDLIRLDPFSVLPREVSLKVLSYLDAFSLGMAAQVSKDWRSLADDDILWRGMCVQHIERKCLRCGWGLPLLERRRLRMEIDGQYSESTPSSTQPSPTLGATDEHSHGHQHHLRRPSSALSLPAAVVSPSMSAPPLSSPSSSRRFKRPSPPSDDDSDEHPTAPSSSRPASALSNKRRIRFSPSPSVSPPPSALPPQAVAGPGPSSLSSSFAASSITATSSSSSPNPPPATSPQPTRRPSACRTLTRPWKDVYTERLIIERNWRKGRYGVKILKGHTDGVMCLQVLEGERWKSAAKGKDAAGSRGSGVLITGSYDRTARVWDLGTGEEVMVLRGHARGIRTLQFDGSILVTGSMDHTMKIWNWRTGTCIRTLGGHTEGVVCLKFDGNVLASGSADSTVKIWNFRTQDCFTLRGHRDWVNALVLWESSSSSSDSVPSSSACTNPFAPLPIGASPIDVGKMLFSGSDDGTIRLWDLASRECVMTFEGHVGQVQSLKLLVVDRVKEADDPTSDDDQRRSLLAAAGRGEAAGGYEPNAVGVTTSASHPMPWEHAAGGPSAGADQTRPCQRKWTIPPASDPEKQAVLVSASLDNMIKIWDVESGRSMRTLFGHIEGVWGVDVDPLRLVSSSHDRTIKIWSREDGKCSQTLFGHRGAVTCLQLTDTQILSGSDDGEVRVWDFGAAGGSGPCVQQAPSA